MTETIWLSECCDAPGQHTAASGFCSDCAEHTVYIAVCSDCMQDVPDCICSSKDEGANGTN